MAVSLRPTTDRSAAASPLLLKLVAACCALLVVLAGAWAISHAEFGLAGAASVAGQAVDAGVQVDESEPAAVAMTDGGEVWGVLLGAVVCLLLVLLGLLPVLFARRLGSAVVLAFKRAVLPRHVPEPSARSFVPALTVAQLSLSRT